MVLQPAAPVVFSTWMTRIIAIPGVIARIKKMF